MGFLWYNFFNNVIRRYHAHNILYIFCILVLQYSVGHTTQVMFSLLHLVQDFTVVYRHPWMVSDAPGHKEWL